MLEPKPSSLPIEQRKKYALETAKKLCDEWNFLPPQEFDKYKIQEYIGKRNEYLGTNLEFVWTTSPKSLKASLKASLWTSQTLFEKSLWASLNESLSASLNESLRASLWTSLIASLSASLSESPWASLWASIGLSLSKSHRTSVMSWNNFLFWDIFYQFNEDESIKNFVIYLPQAYKEAGLGFAVITDNKFYALPLPKYSLNGNNQLHKDMAPAVVWADEEKEYWLNRVRCPEEIVMTPSKDLEAKLLLRTNAEIRREIVRKIGMEKVCEELNAEMVDKAFRNYQHPILSNEIKKDKDGFLTREIVGYEKVKVDYELLILDLGDGRRRPYLKMLNPSTGIYHLEGVPHEIQTIKQALAWKNQSDEEPVIVT